MNNRIVLLYLLFLLAYTSFSPYSPLQNPNCQDPMCAICTDPSICEACDGQYYLNANTCTPCNSAVPNCANCTYNLITKQVDCNQCEMGYYNYTTQYCTLCSIELPYCLNCTNNGITTTCSACQDGYFLDDHNNCRPCEVNIPYCLQCDTIPTAPFEVCTHCFPNYLVDDFGNCVACNIYINECSICNKVSKTCDTCVDGYFRKTSGAVCAPCTDLINNCASCTALDDAGSAITCSKCQTDTYLVGNACVTCGNFITGCTTCNYANYTCDACSIGTFRFGGGVSCNLCDIRVVNCATCYATDDAGLNVACSKCFQNFILKANTCVICKLFITGCTTCNTENSTCNVCAAGNFRDAQGTQCSTCDSRITGCATCAANDDTATTVICSACTAGLYLLNNQCFTCGGFITGCTLCNPTNLTCDSCATGNYRKDHGKFCDLCNNVITSCTECKALDDAGLQVVCTKCAPNTITVSNTCRACSQYIGFCDICNTVTFTCATCSVGYFRKNSGHSCNPCTDYVDFCSKCVSIDDAGTGITCSACSPNSFLVGNACQTCNNFITNCKNCSSQTYCLKCTDKFYLSLEGNACKPCSEIPFCLACKNNGQDEPTCLTCSSGLVVDKGNFCVLCGVKINYCEQCTQTSSLDITCNRCIDGKMLSDDKLSCKDQSISTIIIIAVSCAIGTAALGACYFFYKRMKKRKSQGKKDEDASNLTLI